MHPERTGRETTSDSPRYPGTSRCSSVGDPGRGDPRLGQRESALAQAESVLKNDPTSSRILYHAARVLARVGGASPTLRQRERTLDVLRRMILAMPAGDREKFWKDRVTSDTAFRPLRHLAAFDRIPTTTNR